MKSVCAGDILSCTEVQPRINLHAFLSAVWDFCAVQ